MSKPRDREYLRFRMVELNELGWQQKDIAEALGYSPEHVCRVLKKAREEGLEALKAKPPPGRKPRLTPEDRAQLDLALAKGAEAHGFEGECWTSPRVVSLVEREFGVTYSPGHMCKILHDLGWFRQRPVRRSTRRSEPDVETWRSKKWEALKRKQPRKAARSSS